MLKILISALISSSAFAGRVEVKNHQLHVDGIAQPQLFGAELQYFRLRGGYGPNVPREKVIALWNQAISRMVEAKMNAVSFYIPWDFHEYAEGKFDFTGTVDADGDGRPDYPSRDLKTFFRLLREHGIKRIMARPGPYINAEWGFLGFGAIPQWFHEKFPDSHIRSSAGVRKSVYDYLNPNLLEYSQRWFTHLYNDVLKDEMNAGGPVVFLQIDNETNFQWRSLYDADYGPSAVKRYQDWLEKAYGSLQAVNRTHGRQWMAWREIAPPTVVAENLAEDRDWYRFNDYTIGVYLVKLRALWHKLGVREPRIMFTAAESYNAPRDGLLPNYRLRSASSLLTVNLYPKTSPGEFLFDSPFKSDLDVKSAIAATGSYFGSRQEWALGPEIQGGWWVDTKVRPEARQQTYLSVIGHGLKAVFVYYFSEGNNWDVDWASNKLKPLFESLRGEMKMEDVPTASLPQAFWSELQNRSDEQIIGDLNVRYLLEHSAADLQDLHFDSPLDKDAQPRAHFTQLKAIGEQVVAPYQDFLARSVEAADPIAIIKDTASHAPSPVPSIHSQIAESDWTAGLLGYAMNAGFNPRVILTDLKADPALASQQVLLHLDSGLNAAGTARVLGEAVKRGQRVVNFLANDIPCRLKIMSGTDCLSPVNVAPAEGRVELTYYLGHDGSLRSGAEPDAKPVHILAASPVYTYGSVAGCEPILFLGARPVGLRCGNLLQVGALIFDDYSSPAYATIPDTKDRRAFLRALLPGVHGAIQLSDSSERTVAFARQSSRRDYLWITLKTGTPRKQKMNMSVSLDLLRASLGDVKTLRVSELMSGRKIKISAKKLAGQGMPLGVEPEGSAVYLVEKNH